MIGYVPIGANGFEGALDFYDALFANVGIKRLWRHGHMTAWRYFRDIGGNKLNAYIPTTLPRTTSMSEYMAAESPMCSMLRRTRMSALYVGH
jgi:hypothetical protein